MKVKTEDKVAILYKTLIEKFMFIRKNNNCYYFRVKPDLETNCLNTIENF